MREYGTPLAQSEPPQVCQTIADFFSGHGRDSIDGLIGDYLDQRSISVIEFLTDPVAQLEIHGAGTVLPDRLQRLVQEIGLGPLERRQATLKQLDELILEGIRFAQACHRAIERHRTETGRPVLGLDDIRAEAAARTDETERRYWAFSLVCEHSRTVPGWVEKLNRVMALAVDAASDEARALFDVVLGEMVRRPSALHALLSKPRWLEERLHQLIWLYRADPKVRVPGDAHPTLAHLRNLLQSWHLPETRRLLREARASLRRRLVHDLEGTDPLVSTLPERELVALVRLREALRQGDADFVDVLGSDVEIQERLRRREAKLVTDDAIDTLESNESRPGARAEQLLKIFAQLESDEAISRVADRIGAIAFHYAEAPDAFRAGDDELHSVRTVANMYRAVRRLPNDRRRDRYVRSLIAIQSHILLSTDFRQKYIVTKAQDRRYLALLKELTDPDLVICPQSLALFQRLAERYLKVIHGRERGATQSAS